LHHGNDTETLSKRQGNNVMPTCLQCQPMGEAIALEWISLRSWS
jgi:hypothetical protein